MSSTYLLAGGNSGIGLETRRLLVERGDRVVCAVRNPGQLSDTETVQFDAEVADRPLETPDVLDGVVYFPGTINLKPFGGLKDADFQRDFEVNLLGAVRFLRAALPSLKRAESASVVLFSTVAVQTGLPFHASIAAAKGAVEGLTRSLAAELAPKIRVNSIAPSLTDTPLASRLLDNESKTEAARQRHPLKRVGTANEIAKLVTYLLSEDSRFVTGQIFNADGGLSSIKS
ncbi:MAG: SDR family oxidoreductase [Verrucomicrobiota bacterium]